MTGTDDGEKRRGAGRSGSAGSIGKELGEDLDFEADDASGIARIGFDERRATFGVATPPQLAR